MTIKMMKCLDQFKAKAEESGDVIIEGWINKAVVDSAGDLMKFDAVDMTRFDKNPIVFFNHDRNLPIGKCLEYKVSNEGIWTKTLISKSTNPVVSYVRDLVLEGILKTFSIGFETQEQRPNKAGGYNEVTKWQLHEYSIVTLPCNDAAEFQLVKSLDGAKSYTEAKQMVLNAKGARIASEIAKLNLAPEKLAELAEKAGMTPEEMDEVMRGDNPKAPDSLLAAMAEAFDRDPEELQRINSEEPAKEPETAEPTQAEPKEPTEPGKAEPETAEPAKEPETPAPSGDAEFESCVSEKIPQLIADGKGPDEAIALAIESCTLDGKCSPVEAEQQEKRLAFAKSIAEKATLPLPKEDPTDFGNPHLELTKALLALVGEISTQLKTTNQLLLELANRNASSDNGKAEEPQNTQQTHQSSDTPQEGVQKDLDAIAEMCARIEAMRQKIL
jgi:HK97 family phage prohead protease